MGNAQEKRSENRWRRQVWKNHRKDDQKEQMKYHEEYLAWRTIK